MAPCIWPSIISGQVFHVACRGRHFKQADRVIRARELKAAIGESNFAGFAIEHQGGQARALFDDLLRSVPDHDAGHAHAAPAVGAAAAKGKSAAGGYVSRGIGLKRVRCYRAEGVAWATHWGGLQFCSKSMN